MAGWVYLWQQGADRGAAAAEAVTASAPSLGDVAAITSDNPTAFLYAVDAVDPATVWQATDYALAVGGVVAVGAALAVGYGVWKNRATDNEGGVRRSTRKRSTRAMPVEPDIIWMPGSSSSSKHSSGFWDQGFELGQSLGNR